MINKRADKGSRAADAADGYLLLIHGTNADDPAGFEGSEHWWQRNSSFTKHVVGELARHWDLNVEPSCFRWKGKNLETERRRHGKKLYKRLQEMDQRGVHYCVVAHSHGGSVLWWALQHAARSGRPLKNLRLWITLGTPFLEIRSVYHRVSSLLYLLPAIAAVLFFFPYRLVSWLLLPDALYEVLDSPTLLFLILFLVVMGGLVAKYLAIDPLMAVADFFLDIRRLRTQATALRTFSSRWFGLYSENDEAINGLNLSRSLNPEIWFRLAKKEELPQAEPSWIRRALGLLLHPFRRVHDMTVALTIDRVIQRALQKKLQGLDLTGHYLRLAWSKSPGPSSTAWSPLLPEANNRLVEFANRASGQTISHWRRFFGEAATGGMSSSLLISNASKQMSWKELVHNSYYEHLEIQTCLIHVIGDSLRTAWVNDTPRQHALTGNCKEIPCRRLNDHQVTNAPPISLSSLAATRFVFVGFSLLLITGAFMLGKWIDLSTSPFSPLHQLNSVSQDFASGNQFALNDIWRPRIKGAQQLLWSPNRELRPLHNYLSSLVHAGLVDDAIRAAQAIELQSIRGFALGHLSTEQYSIGETARAEELIENAIAAIGLITSPGCRCEVYASLGQALAAIDRNSEADRLFELATIDAAIAEHEHTLGSTYRNEYNVPDVFLILAKTLASSGRPERARDAFFKARAAQDAEVTKLKNPVQDAIAGLGKVLPGLSRTRPENERGFRAKEHRGVGTFVIPDLVSSIVEGLGKKIKSSPENFFWSNEYSFGLGQSSIRNEWVAGRFLAAGKTDILEQMKDGTLQGAVSVLMRQQRFLEALKLCSAIRNPISRARSHLQILATAPESVDFSGHDAEVIKEIEEGILFDVEYLQTTDPSAWAWILADFVQCSLQRNRITEKVRSAVATLEEVLVPRTGTVAKDNMLARSTGPRLPALLAQLGEVDRTVRSLEVMDKAFREPWAKNCFDIFIADGRKDIAWEIADRFIENPIIVEQIRLIEIRAHLAKGEVTLADSLLPRLSGRATRAMGWIHVAIGFFRQKEVRKAREYLLTASEETKLIPDEPNRLGTTILLGQACVDHGMLKLGREVAQSTNATIRLKIYKAIIDRVSKHLNS